MFSWLRARPELAATIISLILFAATQIMPGGRVLVLPALFTLLLVVLYWVAKPKPRAKE
ncbi:MAG TPA: hypothetical protein VMT89_01465 [Candidatus Acidoferrales bacterium]|nr:hypothetical protein [Candidatus Acidoferrales bacterium]